MPISSKKRKRLDAYINRQLKKEKRQNLISELAKTSAEVADRSAFVTAASLGTGKGLTGQQRLDQDAARDLRIANRLNPKYRAVNTTSDDDEDQDLDLLSEGELPEAPQGEKPSPTEAELEREDRIAKARALFSAAPLQSKTPNIPEIGSALAAGHDGRVVMPAMKKKKRQSRKARGRRTAWGRETEFSDSVGSSDGFNSSETSGDDEDSSEAETLSRQGAGTPLEKNSSDEVEGAHELSLNKDQDSDDTGYSDSSFGPSDSEQLSGTETDDEEQAVLEEAMRLRGLLGDPNRAPPNFDEVDSESLRSVSETESLPFATFDEISDDGRSAKSENESPDEAHDASEEDVLFESNDRPSRRHGFPTTDRSSGFKNWAKSALGLAQSEDIQQVIDDDVYRGPEPIAGLSQKVSDLMDDKIRGPLGHDEPSAKDRSAFAQKYFEELSDRSQGKIKSHHVTVARSQELDEARLKLPVLAEEELIVRTIMENPVTVLCGETGSGKTTQVPQFLFEAGFGSRGSSNPGMIGITQPRRVAALSMAARVGQELGLGPDRVSHQIRYDANVSPATSINFMTDGVLLRELAIDFLLEKYSAVIIDEAHERSINTDVLIGVLSRVVNLRAQRWLKGQGSPLRLVIMSATLRVDDFAGNRRLFDVKPPILQVDARQYPVVTHFSRRTHHDYIGESVKKACKIHARLPPGGILIFLTGQAEIATVCKRLDKRFGPSAVKERSQLRNRRRSSLSEQGKDEDLSREIRLAAKDGPVEVEEIDLVGASEPPDLKTNDDGHFQDDEALETDDEAGIDYDADLPPELRDDTDKPMHVLPLYSLLPSNRQMEVFQPPPDNSRLVVVATNIAETSLTIPGISYVIDCGRAKERKYNSESGIQSFEVDFISKASANQRAGRAGRTGPGHCYRLFSSNMFEEHFAQFAEPEILRTPVDNLVLMMKSMNIDNVVNFPFPTPPDQQALRKAERLLLRLGALEASSTSASRTPSASTNKITALGRSMSLFPLETRLSKLLVQGHQFGCLSFVVALVAALSVGDPFVQEEGLHEEYGHSDEDSALQRSDGEESDLKEKRRTKRTSYHKALSRFAAMGNAMSDPLRLLSVVGAYEHEGGTSQFCRDNYLIPKTMEEIHKLRSQIAQLVRANAAPGQNLADLASPRLQPPTAKQLTVLRQFLTSAYIDQIAIRADLAPESASRVAMLQDGSEDNKVSKQFHTQQRQGAKMRSTRNVAYLAAGIPQEACFIHKSSVLFHQQPPEWIIFTRVVRGRAKGDTLERRGRNWLRGLTIINPHWVYKLAPSLCTLSKSMQIDQKDSRAHLIQAAQDLKRRTQHQQNGHTDQGALEKQVYLIPTYGTGPGFDVEERSSHTGWELPPVVAKQKLLNGKWVTDLA